MDASGLMKDVMNEVSSSHLIKVKSSQIVVEDVC